MHPTVDSSQSKPFFPAFYSWCRDASYLVSINVVANQIHHQNKIIVVLRNIVDHGTGTGGSGIASMFGKFLSHKGQQTSIIGNIDLQQLQNINDKGGAIVGNNVIVGAVHNSGKSSRVEDILEAENTNGLATKETFWLNHNSHATFSSIVVEYQCVLALVGYVTAGGLCNKKQVCVDKQRQLILLLKETLLKIISLVERSNGTKITSTTTKQVIPSIADPFTPPLTCFNEIFTDFCKSY